MLRGIRRHLSFANVASLSALVFAMGGSAYALSIPRNSVSTGQIKRNGVRNSDIRRGAVTTSKVRNRSLKAVDFRLGQLPAGPRGLQGIQGPRGSFGAITVQRQDFMVGTSASSGINLGCPAGSKVIAGGGSINGAASDIAIISSAPWRTAASDVALDGGRFDAWRIVFSNPNLTDTSPASIFAICAQA